jgi:predicted nucleic acid-binding Zn ribbon protein
MQAMRDILRTSLAKSLNALTPLDRLGAAWAVAAGHATASRTTVTAFHEGTVTVTVPDTAWQRQLEMIHGQLRGDLASISRMPVTDILFVLPENATAPPRPAVPRPARKKR